jgi:hypothetical protein
MERVMKDGRESGRPGRLAPFSPEAIVSQGIGGRNFTTSLARLASVKLLRSFVHSPHNLGPVLHGSFTLFFHGACVMNAPQLDSCIPGTSSKGAEGLLNHPANRITSTYFRPFFWPFSPPDFFSSQQANPALLSASPTLNEPAQKFFFQFHLSNGCSPGHLCRPVYQRLPCNPRHLRISILWMDLSSSSQPPPWP